MTVAHISPAIQPDAMKSGPSRRETARLNFNLGSDNTTELLEACTCQFPETQLAVKMLKWCVAARVQQNLGTTSWSFSGARNMRFHGNNKRGGPKTKIML